MAGIKFDITSDNKNLLNSVRQAQTGVTNAISGIERAGMGIESTFSKIKGSVLGGFADIAKGMAGLTALLQGGSFIKDLVADAGKFNIAMKEVSTLSEDVANNLQEYKDKVVDMTGEIPIKADEAAKALYQIESAGHHGADGLNVLKESAKGAIGGVTDTAVTADAITTILNAYKMESSEAQHVSDLLFTTVRLGKTNMSQLGTTIAQVAPVAASFGVSIEDVLAAIASLTKQGTKTSVAVRQVRDAITATTKSMGDGAFQGRSFLDAMDEVAQKAQGSNNALRQDLGTLQALNAVLSLTGKNSQAARQDVADMQNSAGAAEAAYIKMASTAGAQTTILRNNILKEILPIADEMRSMSGAIAGYLNEAFDSGAMDHAIVSLEAFIATYAVYKSLVATTTAWNSAALGGVYSAQIAELQTLIPLKELDGQADLQSAVAKGTLTKEQALLVASLRGEVESRYEEIMAAETAARAELKAATAAEASAQANVAAAEEIYVAAQARMQAAIKGGSASEIEAAKEELNTAARLKNTAATELNTATRQKNGAATMVSVTSKNADTAATLMNTTQEGANTVATGILATAKLQLKRAIDAVNKSFLASPLFWIAATIAAVTYAVYKLVTAESAHEASVRKTNEALKNEIKSQNTQLGENRAALQRLQSEWNKLTNDKERKKWISDNKGEFQKLGIEVDTVKEAENVLVNNTGNVIKAMELRAKAAAYAAMATKKYQEALENREEAKNRRNNPTTGDKISGIFNTGWDFNFSKSIAQEANGAANKLYDAAIYAEREAEDFISEEQKLLKEADDVMKSSKVKSSSSNTKADKDDKKKTANTKKDAERRAKEAADQAAERVRLEREIAEKTIEAQRAAREAVEAAYIAGIEDESERELAQEEFEHKKRLADIERKGEEMKKARYEANKKQWELNNKDKHYETDSAEGRKGWQGVSLSGNELVSLNAELAKENAEYERAARERAESLVASHQSYTDRKIAIDKQYSEDVKRIDAEIAAAQARGDNDSVAALQRSKRQAATDRAKNQSALSLDILKESPEYIRAFEDLEQTSSETLEYLIEEFEKAKQAAAQSLDPKDLKEYTDTIQRMQDEISSRNPFKSLKKSMDDLRKSEKNVKEAKDRLNLAKQKVKAAKDEGKSIEEVKKAENEEAEAQKKYNEAQDDHLKKQKKVKDSGRDAAEVFSKIGDAMNQVSNMIPGIGGEIAGVVSDVAGLATSLITALTFTAEGATAAIRAVESASVILAVISAALQVVQGIMSLLGNKDGYENAKAQYDELVKIWDELIDKKREYLNESWGNEVKQAKKEAEELLKIQEESTRVLAQQRLDVTNGSHSMWYRMWQGSYKYNGQNWQDVAAEIEKELGVTFNGMNDMTLMTAEQLEYIKGKYHGLWAVMDSDFRDFMEKIISFGTKEEEILEDTMTRITGNNYDDIYDNFMDSLYEIADGSEDVMDDIADNWQEMINRMVVNNVVGTRVKEELKSWYEELYNLQDRYNDHLLNDSAYQQELERLRNSYNSIVTSSQQEIENFRQMGIIKTLEETAEEAKKYFEDILDSWKDTLTDLESTTEDWKNTLIDQIFSDLVESAILNAPVTMGEKTFDNFEKYLQDWTDRYKSLIEDTTLSDEERNERLKVLIDEQTTLREQQAEKAKQLAEGIGKDMSEAFSNSLDNLGDSLIEGLLANTEADAENAGKQIALTLIKEMLQTMLASEKYKGRMEEIRGKWQQLLNGEDVAFTMDDVLQDIANLNNDIANDESISALAQQYKELNKQVENTQTVFNDLHNTFLNTLTDMKGDAESFRKTLEQTMLKDFIDKQVLDVPITVNGMDFDDFNAYVEDWNKRYAEEVKAGNMEAVDALLDELMQVREMTLSQAEDLRKRLEDSMHELGSGFNNLRETFIKTLTNIVGDAESLGKEIGQSMMEQMLNAFVEKQYSDRINAVNEEWAKALEEGDPQRIDEIRQKVINLYETISSDRVVKQLSDDIKALTDTGKTPFDNLRSSYLSALTDMNKSTEDFTKEISQMIAESFVDSFVLGDMFDDRIEEWKKRYKDITTDAGLSEEERMKQLRGLSELIAQERESMQGEVSDIYKLLGINDHQDQQATMSLAEAATYDQFELYLGIATAQQIALEQGNVVRQQILSTLQTMGQITSPTNPTLLEMRNMFSTANEYLLDIKRSNREILDSFSLKIDSIIGKLKRL